MTIPAKLHNSLIGSKGCLVRSVMEECGGVHIHFPAEGSGVDRVTIRGPAGEVERARKHLLQLAEEKVRRDSRYRSSSFWFCFCSLSLEAPPTFFLSFNLS